MAKGAVGGAMFAPNDDEEAAKEAQNTFGAGSPKTLGGWSSGSPQSFGDFQKSTGLGTGMQQNAGTGQIEPMGPQAAPQNTKLGVGPGTGFVNIDRYLGANQGAGANVKSANDRALASENSRFMQATQPITSSTPDSSIGTLDEGKIGFALGRNDAKGLLGGFLKSPQMNANYGSNSESINSLNSLANSQTAGRELARQQGVTGGYNPRLAMIDSAIYGQEPGAAGAVKQAGTESKAFLADRPGQAKQVESNANQANQKLVNQHRNTLRR